MSDDNKKLSEFDFDGDSQVNEKVIDHTMMNASAGSQGPLLSKGITAALIIVGAGYYFMKPASSSDVSVEQKNVQEMVKTIAVADENSASNLEEGQMASDMQHKLALKKDTVAAEEVVMSDKDIMNKNGMTKPSVNTNSSSSMASHSGMNKSTALVDDQRWKDLEKEILAQSESQSKVQDEISSLVDKNKMLVNNLDRNLQQTQKIDSELQSFTQSIDKLTRKLASFDKKFDNLNRQISSIESKLTAQAAEFFSQTDLARETDDSTRTDYSLYAVIPGRAWLKGSDNSIISVVEGQSVGKLGTVSTIDPRLAAVTFNNGTILRQ